MAWDIRPRQKIAARAVLIGAVILLLTGMLTASPPAGAHARAGISSLSVLDPADQSWVWPVAAFRIEGPYRAPAHRFGAGHRGVDLRPVSGLDVRAPSAGVVAFSGRVAGRGILTIDHGDGLVTTLEPVESSLAPGAPIRRGALVGTISLGGHAQSGALHLGVRLNGEYINPLLLLGGVPRAVLLPCC